MCLTELILRNGQAQHATYIDAKVNRRRTPNSSDAGGRQHGLHRVDAIRDVA